MTAYLLLIIQIVTASITTLPYQTKPTITIRQSVLLYKSDVDESTHTTEYCWKLPHKYIVTASTRYTLPAKQYIS